MSETALSASIRAAILSMGYRCERVNSGSVPTRGGWYHGASTGTPDTIIVHPYGWLETKTDEYDLSEGQKKWHREHAALGVRIAVVRSVEQALRVVKGWAEDDQRKLGR